MLPTQKASITKIQSMIQLDRLIQSISQRQRSKIAKNNFYLPRQKLCFKRIKMNLFDNLNIIYILRCISVVVTAVGSFSPNYDHLIYILKNDLSKVVEYIESN